MENLLSKAKEIVQSVLKEIPNFELGKIPKRQGVYLIYKDGKVIYVGKGKNLKRRITNDHLSAEPRDTMSAFRRKVNRFYKIQFGPEMKKWISENCLFVYKEIVDADMCGLVESLLIALLRKQNQDLLNS